MNELFHNRYNIIDMETVEILEYQMKYDNYNYLINMLQLAIYNIETKNKQQFCKKILNVKKDNDKIIINIYTNFINKDFIY